MLDAWIKVLPEDPSNAGHYYTLRPPSQKAGPKDYEWLTQRQQDARHERQWDKLWFYDLVVLLK